MSCGANLSSRILSTYQNEIFTMLNPADYQAQTAQKSSLRDSVSDSIIQQTTPMSENVSAPVTDEPQWKTWKRHFPISCSSYSSASPSSSGFSQMPETQTTHVREMGFPDGAGTFPPPYDLPQVYGPSFSKLPPTSETSEICLMRQPLDWTSTNITRAEINPYGVDTQLMYTFPPERHAIFSVHGPVQQVEHGKRKTCNCSRMRSDINCCFCDKRNVPLPPPDRQIDHKEEPEITSTVPAMSSALWNLHEGTMASQQDPPPQEVPVVHPLIPAVARNTVLWDTAKIDTRLFDKFNDPCPTSTRLHAPEFSLPFAPNTPIKVTPFENVTSCLSCAKRDSCIVHTRAEALPPQKKRKWGGEEEAVSAEPTSNDTNVGDNRDQVNLMPMISVSEGVKLKRRCGQRGQQRRALQSLFQSTGQSAPPEADPVGSAMSLTATSGSITHPNPKVRRKLAPTTFTPMPLPAKASQSLLQFTGQSVPPKPDLVSLKMSPPSVAASRSITHSYSKVQEKPVTATLTPGPLQRGKNGVPTPIPNDMRALIDAYVKCVPVGVFATKAQIKGFWGLDLARKEEFGCSFMGLYRISRIWECLEEEKASIGTSGAEFREPVEDTITAGVRWKFRMKWEPGGEDWQTVRRDDLSSPWWNPSLKAKGLSGASQPELDDSDEESTEAYRSARRKNPNFARRHCSFSQTFLSVLPLHLLAPVDVEMPDSSLPKGWYCQDCGKLNFRYHLRHCRCCSSYCQVRSVI